MHLLCKILHSLVCVQAMGLLFVSRPQLMHECRQLLKQQLLPGGGWGRAKSTKDKWEMQQRRRVRKAVAQSALLMTKLSRMFTLACL